MTEPRTPVIERLNAALEGRYRIERELGEGGMATVYLAEDLKHHRKVAVKVLKPELAAVMGGERFLAEIETTANLQHPHILPLYDSGQADSFLFYVMPYVEGESLRERIERAGELPVDQALSIVSDVAEALDYAHRQGVIHRDVKPANILLQEGRPLVADFGIALAVSAAGGGRLTETGLSLGTPHYMSPEQATADRVPGPASDVYSLGCVLYEMLTARPPFSGPSAQAVLGQIITGEPTRPTSYRKSIPPHVESAILKALEKLPGDRFGSAADFATAVKDPDFRYRGAATENRGSAGVWKLVSMVAGLVAVAALALAAWGWLRPAPPEPVTRYRLTLPDHQNPAAASGLGVGRFALSPDGRRVAFVGGSGDLTEVWLLDRSALEAVSIPTGTATKVSYSPFFSPEGDRLGFLNDAGDVVTVSLSGGAPLTLGYVVANTGGGDWGENGYIYFDAQGSIDDQRVGIGRYPEGGGELELVTAVDTAGGDVAHVWPHLLPGGRILLYTALGTSANRIVAHDLESGESWEIARGLRPQYVDPGYLLWVTEGTLVAAPFDGATGRLTGSPVSIVEDISITGAFPTFAASQNGTLLYATGTGGAVAEPVWVERDGRVRPIQDQWQILISNFFQAVALSPDDTRLVLAIQGTTLDLWLKQLDEGPLSRLTFEGAGNFRARWSPDGERILFSSDRGGDQALWMKATDGSGTATRLLEGVTSNQLDIAPDGEWLAYRVGRDLLATRLDGESDPVTLVDTEYDELAPAISPDGRWVAYLSSETGRDEIYVRPFPDADGGRWQVSTAGGSEPLWSRDGRELYYRNGDNDMVAVEVLEGETFRTGRQEVLFNADDFWSNRFQRVYDVTADGRFVLLRRSGATVEEEVIIVENFVEELKARIGR